MGSMPRPKTGDKRAAILRAATKTIAEYGIGASTASIAKAAAVAEGSLFRYFPDKDKLLNELYRELVHAPAPERQRAIEEAERRRRRGQPYTLADYLHDRHKSPS